MRIFPRHSFIYRNKKNSVAKLAAWGFYFYHDSGCNQFCASGGHGFRSGICKTQLLPQVMKPSHRLTGARSTKRGLLRLTPDVRR